MPNIAIKGFLKDDETIRRVAEYINATLLELWGCRQESTSSSLTKPCRPKRVGRAHRTRRDHAEPGQDAERRVDKQREKITINADGQKLYEAHPSDDYEAIKESVGRGSVKHTKNYATENIC